MKLNRLLEDESFVLKSTYSLPTPEACLLSPCDFFFNRKVNELWEHQRFHQRNENQITVF